MDLLLSTGSVHHLSPDTAFWVAHVARFDGVELLLDERWSQAGLEAAIRCSRKYQVPVHSLHVPLAPVPGWGDYWGNVRRSLEWARGLGATCLVVHPHAPVTVRSARSRRGRLARRLEGLRAAAADMTVALENLPRSVNPVRRLFQPIETLRGVVRLAAQAGIKIAFDTTHLATWGIGIVSAFHGALPLVANLHLSDYAPGQQHLLPKRGSLPLADLLETGRPLGYKGPVTLEVRPDALGSGPAEAVAPLLMAARKWLRRHAGP